MHAVALLLVLPLAGQVAADESLTDAKPVPLMQVVPQPHDSASIEREGRELTRWHFGGDLRRPYLFPIIGPAGRSLTRIGHPHDAVGHSHHNSIWISHADVNGVDFWGDRGGGKIVYRPLVRGAYHDSDAAALIRARLDWIDEKSDGKTLLHERRQITAMPLDRDEWLMLIDLELIPAEGDVTLGKTPFGFVGVRLAKTIGMHDGGGRILNSAGQRNEAEAFWKAAKWVDYSGPITRDAVEGIALFDHPENPNYPATFHVRDDGWMGASLSFAAPLIVRREAPLRLRYGLFVHAEAPSIDALDRRHAAFAKLPLLDWESQWNDNTPR